MRDYMIQAAIYTQGNYRKMCQLIEKKRLIPYTIFKGKALVIGDKDYPICFYDLKEPPFVLFYEGDLSLLNKGHRVGVIGSRHPSEYAICATKDLMGQLVKNHVIVSGLAKGIDTIAHHRALDFNTVAVLGCGIDVYYPRENKELQRQLKKDHLVISEYPSGVAPFRYHFPFRNRLIAALSKELFVMAAAHRSGTMKTVELALEMNRSVTCLPHSIYEFTGEGCNTLIKDGAGILTEHDINS